MPKRKKTKEEKERIIEKSSLSQEEMNSLEQRLEKDEEKTDFSELKEFLEETETQTTRISPSLRKINAPQRNPVRLERNLIEDTPTPNTNQTGNEEQNSLNYLPKAGGNEEKKYIQYQGKIIENIIPHTDIQNLGRGNIFERREIVLQNPQQDSSEKYMPVKKVDKDTLGRGNPLQRKEIKYTPEKY
ncbi:MAG: hypothetical protein AABY32_05360 [Nanoarchaeota archaeon]